MAVVPTVAPNHRDLLEAFGSFEDVEAEDVLTDRVDLVVLEIHHLAGQVALVDLESYRAALKDLVGLKSHHLAGQVALVDLESYLAALNDLVGLEI